MLRDVVIILVAYLLGSVSWGMLFARASGVDLTKVGSGGTGGTNAIRALGPVKGLAVGLLDILKAAFAVWLARRFGTYMWTALVAGMAVVLGHNYSIFLGFRGGKGVATSIGVQLMLVPAAFALALPVALLIVYISKYVSLGSLTFVTLVPLFQIALGLNPVIVVFSVVLAAVVYLRHESNIQRLRMGKERRLGETG